MYERPTMFKNLSQKFGRIIHKLSGQGRITDENIQEVLSDIRSALLEADVGLSVVKQFVEDVQKRAVGKEVLESLTPGDVFVKIVYEELQALLGSENEGIRLNAKPPVVILMAGLQGSGKTTTSAKLARFLKENQKKSVLLASVDIYRPAAIKQLETLANEIQVEFFDVQPHQKPLDIVRDAIESATNRAKDVLILDTAGRLHIDEAMMEEIKAIHSLSNPTEVLLVVDSMAGQDAVLSAKAFNEALPITGVVLTKLDGDAKGGAAVSIRATIGKPIKFIGVGEKTTALEPFYPDRIASRILDRGDILSLVEQVEKKFNKEEAEKLAKKVLRKGQFDFEDFLAQLQQVSQLGGVMGIMDKIPGMSGLPQAAKSQMNDQVLVKSTAIIRSMTVQERRFPAVIRGSRKKRIALGSGTQVQDVNRLLKQFEQMQKMMKKFSGRGGMANVFDRFKGGQWRGA
jgi:signal recognition particle subunit SRP54